MARDPRGRANSGKAKKARRPSNAPQHERVPLMRRISSSSINKRSPQILSSGYGGGEEIATTSKGHRNGRKHPHPREQQRSTFPMPAHAHLFSRGQQSVQNGRTPSQKRIRAHLIRRAGTRRKRCVKYAQDGRLGKRTAAAAATRIRVAFMCACVCSALLFSLRCFRVLSWLPLQGRAIPRASPLSSTHAKRGMDRLPTHAHSQLRFHEGGLNKERERENEKKRTERASGKARGR